MIFASTILKKDLSLENKLLNSNLIKICSIFFRSALSQKVFSGKVNLIGASVRIVAKVFENKALLRYFSIALSFEEKYQLL